MLNREESKTTQIVTLLDQLKDKREKIETLEKRTTIVIDQLEQKLLTSLSASRNIPNVALVTPIIESLSSLYKTNLDANVQFIRSVEKEVDLVAKHIPDEEGNTSMSLSHDLLSKMFQKSLGREVHVYNEEEEE
jgi:regulator of PEP synthase PpsR (kinase-PPPase family)